MRDLSFAKRFRKDLDVVYNALAGFAFQIKKF